MGLWFITNKKEKERSAECLQELKWKYFTNYSVGILKNPTHQVISL